METIGCIVFPEEVREKRPAAFAIAKPGTDLQQSREGYQRWAKVEE